jgi:hypothetical protein
MDTIIPEILCEILKYCNLIDKLILLKVNKRYLNIIKLHDLGYIVNPNTYKIRDNNIICNTVLYYHDNINYIRWCFSYLFYNIIFDSSNDKYKVEDMDSRNILDYIITFMNIKFIYNILLYYYKLDKQKDSYKILILVCNTRKILLYAQRYDDELYIRNNINFSEYTKHDILTSIMIANMDNNIKNNFYIKIIDTPMSVSGKLYKKHHLEELCFQLAIGFPIKIDIEYFLNKNVYDKILILSLILDDCNLYITSLKYQQIDIKSHIEKVVYYNAYNILIYAINNKLIELSEVCQLITKIKNRINYRKLYDTKEIFIHSTFSKIYDYYLIKNNKRIIFDDKEFLKIMNTDI